MRANEDSQEPRLQVTLYPASSGGPGRRWAGWYVVTDSHTVVRRSSSWTEVYRAAARRARRVNARVRVWWVGEGRASLVLEVAPAPAVTGRPRANMPESSAV